jgi:hypothetical protein
MPPAQHLVQYIAFMVGAQPISFCLPAVLHLQTPEQYVFVYKALLDDLASRIQQGDPEEQEG